MRKILIIGAASAIAEATARRWAAQGAALHLLARDGERIAAIAADLRVRGAAEVTTGVLNVNNIGAHEEAIASARVALGGFDVALLAHGTLPDQAACWSSVADMLREFDTNARSTLALMTALASVFEAQGHGTLAVISSVAGERGRASNAIYGAAKSAVTAYASALRQRLVRHGAQVLTVKPGFVDTPMTARIAGKGALWATPEAIAAGIVRAVERQRAIAYLPWFWRPVMAVIRALPEAVFARMRF